MRTFIAVRIYSSYARAWDILSSLTFYLTKSFAARAAKRKYGPTETKNTICQCYYNKKPRAKRVKFFFVLYFEFYTTLPWIRLGILKNIFLCFTLLHLYASSINPRWIFLFTLIFFHRRLVLTKENSLNAELKWT